MRQGTTPTHEFALPFDVSAIAEVMIIYAQNDVQLFTKETADCTLEGRTVSVTLTQAETFMFEQHNNVQIQLRVLTTAGEAFASDVYSASVGRCLNEEVI